MHFSLLSRNWNLMRGFDAYWIDKHACQLSRCWELFLASLSQTLTKLQDGVLALTKFSELKLDERFRFIFDRKTCTPTFTTSRAICPHLSPTLSKLHGGVSLLSSFLEFKFDHKFGCRFDEQVCMQTFETFQNIFTPFKPNLSKIAQRSFTFH